MKKSIVGIAATVLSAAMCLSFAACGNMSAKRIKGAEVTEKQWDAAFEALTREDAEFTVDCEGENISTVQTDASAEGGKKSGTLTTVFTETYVIMGTQRSLAGEQTNSAKGDYAFADLLAALGRSPGDVKEGKEKIGEYVEKIDADYTAIYILKANGSWSWIPLDSSDDDLDPIDDYGQYGNFGKFKYDETLKGYVDAGYTESSDDHSVYKFNEEGQLTAIYLYHREEKTAGGSKTVTSREVSMTISYGAGELALPSGIVWE